MVELSHEWEVFLFGESPRRRLTKVVGKGLRTGNPTPRLTGKNAPQPLSQYELFGGALPGYRLEHTERGHLVGLQFGGPESIFNLVPMYSGFNGQAGAWGQMEAQLAGLLGANGHRRVTMTVNMMYAAPEDAIPCGFVASFTSDGQAAFPFETFRSFQVHVHPPAQVAYDFDDEFDPSIIDTLKSAQKQMMAERWRVETAGVIQVPGIRARPLQVGAVNPDLFDPSDEMSMQAFYHSRPYAVLDWLWFNHPTVFVQLGFGRPGQFDNTRAFSEAQKSAIRKVNILAHLGYMVSDIHDVGDDWEPYRNLYIGSADAQAQVDHIAGRAGSGSNCFSNARLISKMANIALNNAQTKDALNASYEDPDNRGHLAKRLWEFWTGL